MTAMMIGFIALGVWFGVLLFIALGWRFFGFFGDGFDGKKNKKKVLKKLLTRPPDLVFYSQKEEVEREQRGRFQEREKKGKGKALKHS